MNFFTKTRILVGAVIILAALNIATLFTIGFHFIRMRRDLPPQPPQEIRHTRFMSKELDFNEQQQEEFRHLRENFQRETRSIRSEIRNTHRQSMIELSLEEPDFQLIDSLSDEIAKLHKQQFDITIDHFRRVKSVCTPEQQKGLQRMFFRMMPDEDMPHTAPNSMHVRRRERFKRNNDTLTD